MQISRSCAGALVVLILVVLVMDPAYSQNFVRHGQWEGRRVELQSVSPLDYNQDGIADIFVQPQVYGIGFVRWAGGDSHWLRDRGGGRFVPIIRFNEDVFRNNVDSRLYPMDVDADGNLDFLQAWTLVIERLEQDLLFHYQFRWWHNDGENNYDLILVESEPAVRLAHPGSFYTGDLDNDGDIDVITDLGEMRAFEMDDGEFFLRRFQQIPERPAALVDIDGDGWLDVVLEGQSGFDALRNLQDWEFERGVLIGFEEDVAFWGAEFADLDNDGDADLIGYRSDPDGVARRTLRWWENRGEDGFHERIIGLGAGPHNYNWLKATDLDGDGDIDFVLAGLNWDWDMGPQAGRLEWWENNGEQRFRRHVIDDDLFNIMDLVVTDVDGDGDSDIVLARILNGELIWFEQTQVEPAAINLSQGWSLVSSFVTPEWDDVPVLMRDFDLSYALRMVKDDQGRFYMPQAEFNNIPFWDPLRAYWVNMNAPRELRFAGEPMAEDLPIPLMRGWNSTAYLPEQEVDARDAFAGIRDDLLMAKDGRGRFYVPRWGFSNMRSLSRGNGYQVNVTQDVELVWNVPGGSVVAGGASEVGDVASHFIPPPLTGRNMSLLIVNCKMQIANWSGIKAVSDHGLVVGGCEIPSPDQNLHFTIHNLQSLGFAVWGDDPTTPEKDGLYEGERFELRLWDDASDSEMPLKVTAVVQGEGLVYATDGLSVVEAAIPVPTLPEAFTLFAPFPNPFNDVVSIRYVLPKAAEVSLKVYDLGGRVAARLGEGTVEAGVHQVVWDTAGSAAGVYFLRFEAGGRTAAMKLVLVR